MTTLRNRLLALIALTTVLFGGGTAAWSFWSATAGAGTATASTGTLAPPASVTGTPSGSAVSLHWTATFAAGGASVDGYYVLRSPGSAGGTCTSAPSAHLGGSVVSCSDTGVAAGTYTYSVVAVYRSWTASAASSPVTVAPVAIVDHFRVTAPATATAGTAFTVTLSAEDAANNTVTSYAGSPTMAWSGPGSALSGTAPTYPGAVTFTNGSGSASITLAQAETTTLTVTTAGVSGTSGSIDVGHGPAVQFSVVAPTPQTAGIAFAVSLTAQDAFRNTATSYAGPKAVLWSGPGPSPSGAAPTYPSAVTFTNGVGSAPVTLTRAEAVAITATQGSAAGTSSAVVVNAGAAARLGWAQVSVTSGTLSSPCLFTCTGTVGNNVSFTARVAVTDPAGNTVTNLGTGHTVTVSTPGGGAFTSPAAGTSVTLTIASTGVAESTTTFTYRTQNGNWTTNSFTAAKSAGTAYTSATASLLKN